MAESIDENIDAAKKPSQIKLLMIMSAIGVLVGFATYVMKQGIHWVGVLVTHGMHINDSNYLFFALPISGLLLAMIFQRYVVHHDLSHGTRMVRVDLKNGKYRFAPDTMFSSIIGCSITVGLGGSAGAEGPSAYTGAAIASNIARWTHLPEDLMRILVACGAGAGIAGIFKSPVGGVLFTLEVIGIELTTTSMVALILICLVSSCTALAFGGFSVDLQFVNHLPFNSQNIFWMILLGLFCGLYSIYYNYTRKWTTKVIDKIGSPWTRAILAGGFLAVAIFFFPALYGEGYNMVEHIVNGHGSRLLSYSIFDVGHSGLEKVMIVTAAVLALKGIMVSATIEGGGVAGAFAPTLFAGCLAGYIFGTAMNSWFGASLPPENFALLGMAGVMSGTIKAPLMAIFITAEMSDSLPFIFGFLIVAAISYGTVRAFTFLSTRLKARKQIVRSGDSKQ